MVFFHSGHTASMALLPEVNGQKRVVLLGGIEKNRQVIQGGSHYRQVLNGNDLVIFFLYTCMTHPVIFLPQTTESPSDTVAVLNPDSMTVDNSKDSNGNISTIVLNPRYRYSFTYSTSSLGFILYIRAALFPPKGHQQ